MAPHKLMLLLALLLVTSFDMSMAGGKFENKNKNDNVIPKFPISPPSQPILALHQYRVEIYNDLDKFVLNSHCFSKDDDLGLHVLKPYEQHNWTFRDNVLETTQFHCKLEWQIAFLEFTAFKGDIPFLSNFCGNSVCGWSARQDGVYLTDKNGQYVFSDYWEMLMK